MIRAIGTTLLLVCVTCLLWGTTATAETTREYFQRMDEVYKDYMDKRPSEVSTSGTGFKPYMRYKWFTERRLNPDGNMTPGARWEAFQELQEMVAERGRVDETWFCLGPTNVAGRCLAVEVHPEDSETIYAGFASSGIWKSVDFGTTWIPLDDLLPTLAISAIEIDVNNPDRIWIGTGEGWNNIDAVHGVGLLVSNDAGATWETTGLSYPISQGHDQFEIEHNPTTGTLVVAQENGLYRSTDDGETWTQVETGSWRDVELKRGSSTTMFACRTQQGFYVSNDDGATWTKTTAGTPTTGLGNMRFALTDINSNAIYWAIDSGSSMKGIWKSSDGGSSFSQVYYPGTNHYGSQGWYDLTIAVDPQDGNRVWSGGIQLHRSTNGGVSFTQIASNVHVDHHATFWDPSSPDFMWIGTDGGVYRSTNSGNGFSDRNSGLITLQYYAMNHSMTLPTRAIGGTQDNGTWVYNNSTFHSYVLGGDGFQCEIDYANEQTVYAELYFGDHYRSLTGGGGMSSINTGITVNGPWETPTHMDISDPHTLWTGHNGRMYKTTNRGDSWYQTTGSFTGTQMGIHQSLNNPEVVVAVTSSRVYVSTDYGETWEDRTNGMMTSGRIADVHCHPDDPNTFVVALTTYSATIPQLYKTDDQGATYYAIDTGLPNEPMNTIEIDPSNPNWYFVGSDLAVYVSFEGGTGWVPMNVGLPHVVIEDIRLHDSSRFLRAGTHGRGMWELDISGLVPTAVDAADVTVEPLTLRVLGNPVSERATIHFGIREAGHIRLGLYDVSGRLVRLIADRSADPVVDNVDVDLGGLPGGVYFARLDANGASISKKLVLTR